RERRALGTHEQAQLRTLDPDLDRVLVDAGVDVSRQSDGCNQTRDEFLGRLRLLLDRNLFVLHRRGLLASVTLGRTGRLLRSASRSAATLGAAAAFVAPATSTLAPTPSTVLGLLPRDRLQPHADPRLAPAEPPEETRLRLLEDLDLDVLGMHAELVERGVDGLVDRPPGCLDPLHLSLPLPIAPCAPCRARLPVPVLRSVARAL